MRKRIIKKVAVLGAGVMGSAIAAHFANAGFDVLLLDVVPNSLNDEEKKAKLSLKDPKVRNRIVNNLWERTIKSKPSPLFDKSFADRVSLGNFEDDIEKIKDADWIIEAIVEDLKVKDGLFKLVEEHRKKGSLITSNTSGIPVNLMTKKRSEDFNKHFCGTHFFNPPRYLRLLEVIPTKHTTKEVISFIQYFGDLYLGKSVIECKDSPAFIANRIGIFAIMHSLKVMKDCGLTITEVDQLTGPLIGRPKSATFRTLDVVGLDTLARVTEGLYQALEDKDEKEVFKMPDYLKKMLKKKWFGAKTKQGFYKKVKQKDGSSEILALDLEKLEYKPQSKNKVPLIEQLKALGSDKEKFQLLFKDKSKAGEFYRKSFFALFSYVADKTPEIAGHLYRIDEAVKAGFGWKYGPFETWDMAGKEDVIKMMESDGFKVADWAKKADSFYKLEDGKKLYFDLKEKKSVKVLGTDTFIILKHLNAENKVWGNDGCDIIDIGDGVINVAFHTKMNVIGGEVLEGLNKAVDLAENSYQAIVVGNQEENFSAGANLSLIFMMAVEQDFDEVDFAIRQFQSTLMRLKYASVPVVAAPHNLCLGGGCELSMQSDAIQASAETYIGLVEFGAGLIPGGGGTKEMIIRAADAYEDGDIELNTLRNSFLTIGQAKVATSAYQAYAYNYFRSADKYSMNPDRVILDAKRKALEIAESGYVPPAFRKRIKVQGRPAMGMFYAGTHAMAKGNFITEYDEFIANKLAYVMTGGDLSEPSYVDEQYLLDLEREVFISLCGERKTLERMESLLKTGKPLRN